MQTLLPLRMRPPGVKPSHLDDSIVLSPCDSSPRLQDAATCWEAERFLRDSRDSRQPSDWHFLPNQCCQTDCLQAGDRHQEWICGRWAFCLYKHRFLVNSGPWSENLSWSLYFSLRSLLYSSGLPLRNSASVATGVTGSEGTTPGGLIHSGSKVWASLLKAGGGYSWASQNIPPKGSEGRLQESEILLSSKANWCCRDSECYGFS